MVECKTMLFQGSSYRKRPQNIVVDGILSVTGVKKLVVF